MTDAMDAAGDVPDADSAAALRPDLQPDTQGDPLLEAELGEDGQGDLAPGDERGHSGDAPDDLRSDAPAGPVRSGPDRERGPHDESEAG